MVEDFISRVTSNCRKSTFDILSSETSEFYGTLRVGVVENEFRVPFLTDNSNSGTSKRAIMKQEASNPSNAKTSKSSVRVFQNSVQSTLKSSNSSVQIQPSFQQDPNDLVGAMQSLETGEKLFSCKLCGLQGKQRQNVRRHVVLKHMQSLIETVKCSICGKEFTLKSNLKSHYISAHGMPENLAKAAVNSN